MRPQEATTYKINDCRNVIFKMIDTLLTKKKFQDFFQKNPPATQ